MVTVNFSRFLIEKSFLKFFLLDLYLGLLPEAYGVLLDISKSFSHLSI